MEKDAQITAIKIIEWDMAHRVAFHEGKCKNFHGHRYKGHFFVRQNERTLDTLGRVVDFSEIKTKIGNWIDEFLDHTLMVWENDPKLNHVLNLKEEKLIYISKYNPTAENIANDLLKNVCPTLLSGTGIEVIKIKLYETPTCYVIAELK